MAGESAETVPDLNRQARQATLALTATVLVVDRMRLGRTTWRAFALACGALAGAYFQFVQTAREGPMIETIRQYNRADVVFTALLPFADDPRALLAEIGIDPGCAIYSGKRAWQLPDLPERTCRGLVNFTRTREIGDAAASPDHRARSSRCTACSRSIRGSPTTSDTSRARRSRNCRRRSPSIGRPLHAWPRTATRAALAAAARARDAHCSAARRAHRQRRARRDRCSSSSRWRRRSS